MYNSIKIKTVFPLLFLLFLTSSCNVREDLYTESKGLPVGYSVTLTTDWSTRGKDIVVPSAYTLWYDASSINNISSINPYSLNYLSKGTYTLHLYTETENVSIADGIANVNKQETYPSLDYFFTSIVDIVIDGKSKNYAAPMRQQVRSLGIILNIKGDYTTLESVNGNLSGIANSLVFHNHDHSDASDVQMTFLMPKSRQTPQIAAVVNLLGITPEDNILTLTLNYNDGSSQNFIYDATKDMEDFNKDKHEPFYLIADLEVVGFTGFISGWRTEGEYIIVK